MIVGRVRAVGTPAGVGDDDRQTVEIALVDDLTSRAPPASP